MLRQPCAEIWQRSCQLQFSFARLDRVAFREERLRKRRRAERESKKVIEVAFLANVAIAIRKYVAALTEVRPCWRKPGMPPLTREMSSCCWLE